MREGRNPNLTVKGNGFGDIMLSVVTHLLPTESYHSKRMEVVRTCLTSMREHCVLPVKILIWDNGSCPELIDWVEQIYKPDIFVKSYNIGKPLAKRAIAGMLPPNTIMGFSDDDMYFEENWLEPQLELLQTFPNVACVSGYPLRTSFRWGNELTKERLKKVCKFTAGKIIPEKWERDFCTSIGRNYNEHAQKTISDYEIVAQYMDKKAFLTSHHCQFIGYAGIIYKAAQIDYSVLGDEKPFDINMDKLGNRLATTQRLTRHMGNVIDDQLRSEIMVK